MHTPDDLDRAKKQALNFLSFRLRSVKEVELFLKRKNHFPAAVRAILADLIETGFLDDEKFSDWWAEARIRAGWGPAKIKPELLSKGIGTEIVDRMMRRDWKKIIETAIEKYTDKFSSLSTIQKRIKLKGLLIRKGFNWDQIRAAIDDIGIKG